MDTIKASWASTFTSLRPHCYIWRGLSPDVWRTWNWWLAETLRYILQRLYNFGSSSSWTSDAGDPIAKRSPSSPPRDPATTAVAENIEEPQSEESAISELRKRLNITVPLSCFGRHIVDESEDKEFCDLALMFSGENVDNDTKEAIMALRDHWKTVEPKSILLKELGPLRRDYQRLISRQM